MYLTDYRSRLFALYVSLIAATMILPSNARVTINDEGSPRMILKEQMKPRDGFVKQERSPSDMIHEVVIAMHQNNVNKLEKTALERSTPGHPLYQKWLSFDEVGEMTANPVAIKAVKSWLVENGVLVTWSSPHGEFIKASARISLWEKLLKTEFYRFEDHSIEEVKQDKKRTLSSHVRCEAYNLPDHLIPHIFSIFYTSQPHSRILDLGGGKTNVHMDNIRSRKEKGEQNLFVSPYFLNQFYGIDSNKGSATLSQAVFETGSTRFSPDDLASFQEIFDITPKKAAIDDGGSAVDQSECCNSGYTADCSQAADCLLGNTNIQYLMGIAQRTPSKVSYIAADDFGDALVQFVTHLAEQTTPASVNTISYGFNEAALSKTIIDTFNLQAAKLAAMGVTLVVMSGEDGVAGPGCRSATNSSCFFNSGSNARWSGRSSWSGQGYFPQFPASSPWVTTVGGTMGPTVGVPEAAAQSDLGGVLTSGGGFSTYSARPDWQNASVTAYLQTIDRVNRSTAPPAPGYNRNGRGYPDVSFLSVDYPAVIANQIGRVYGTSVAATVFAAMITLVNTARQKLGLGTVGFVNPSLYAASAASKFNDITTGSNNCCSQGYQCCTSGFSAEPGWDPVTGLGSISFSHLLSVFGAAVSDTKTAVPTPAPTTEPIVQWVLGEFGLDCHSVCVKFEPTSQCYANAPSWPKFQDQFVKILVKSYPTEPDPIWPGYPGCLNELDHQYTLGWPYISDACNGGIHGWYYMDDDYSWTHPVLHSPQSCVFDSSPGKNYCVYSLIHTNNCEGAYSNCQRFCPCTIATPASPTNMPTTVPSPAPSSPTTRPTPYPTAKPSKAPLPVLPSRKPTASPSVKPSKSAPTRKPSILPTVKPSKTAPTRKPTAHPTRKPTKLSPTRKPTTVKAPSKLMELGKRAIEAQRQQKEDEANRDPATEQAMSGAAPRLRVA